MFALLISVLAVFVGSVYAKDVRMPPPHIILIVADDMGWSDAGCYGSEISTPALDSLAQAGTLFSRFYTSPRCSPSRACLMTSRYAHAVGMGHLDHDLKQPGYKGSLSKSVPTLPEWLKQQGGYATYMVGKWHLGKEKGARPWERGFDRFRGFLHGSSYYFQGNGPLCLWEDGRPVPEESLPNDFYMTDDISSQALRYIEEASKTPNKPFFLYVAYNAPHTPLQAKKATIDQYLDFYKKTSKDQCQLARIAKQQKLGLLAKSEVIPAHRRLPSKISDESALRMSIYAAQITDMDAGIGRIIELLKAKGLWDNSIVAFVSDNGATKELAVKKEAYKSYPGKYWKQSGYGKDWASVSNTPLKGYKIQTHEGGVSVPCIIYRPNNWKKSAHCAVPVHMIDLAAMLMKLGVGTIPDVIDGIPLDEMIERPELRSRLLFGEHEKNKWVLSSQFKMITEGNGAWKLFDIEDRLELKDISQHYPDEVKRLDKEYKKWAKRNQADATIHNYWPKR